MDRHFFTLYALIVATLAAVSWGQEQLSRAYERRHPAEDPNERALFAIVGAQVRDLEPAERAARVNEIAQASGVELELLDRQDIAGTEVPSRLRAGERATMAAAGGQTWILQELGDAQVLAFKYTAPPARRTPLEWTLVFVFYAAIALVIMLWLWPLRRDLRRLERATASFGDRNWRFDARIGERSQVFPLAQAFQRMATRIDRLIASHKDMSNAMSHEIKTPLARMRFEIEMARMARDPQQFGEHLDHLDRDIDELNAFVTATLEYAILERAEVALNVAAHDFTQILPALAQSVGRLALSDVAMTCDVAPEATNVRCDIHLIETLIRNLLHNAARHARSRVQLHFTVGADGYLLHVDDDGGGIAPADRERVFESFVQLDGKAKSGFGLGLAIVKRIAEWHGGGVRADAAALGGARFEVTWPLNPNAHNAGA
jgi:two-component system OmpR family sensor kinase